MAIAKKRFLNHLEFGLEIAAVANPNMYWSSKAVRALSFRKLDDTAVHSAFVKLSLQRLEPISEGQSAWALDKVLAPCKNIGLGVSCSSSCHME